MRRTGLMLALLVTVAGGAEAACYPQGHSCNLRPGARRCCAPLTCQAHRCLPPTTSTTTQAPTTSTSTTTSTTATTEAPSTSTSTSTTSTSTASPTTTTTSTTTSTTRIATRSTTTSTTVGATTTTMQAGARLGLYGVWGANSADFPTLQPLGVNFVVETFINGGTPTTWTHEYDAAVASNIRLIPILWDTSTNQTVWNCTADTCNLDSTTDVGAQFVQFLQAHPAYAAQTVALYAFHEPFNPGNGTANRTVAQVRRLWLDLHARGLKVYGESNTHIAGCANGCNDYAGWGIYDFEACGYGSETITFNAMGVSFSLHTCIPEATAQADSIDWIDTMNAWYASQPAAPDGTRTQIIPLVQTFQGTGPDHSRMPTGADMVAWGETVVGTLKPTIVGMAWYSYHKACSCYLCALYECPDAARTEAIAQVAAILRTAVAQ